MAPPGRRWRARPARRASPTPRTAPTIASPARFRPSRTASPAVARTRKKRTKGRARPSFRPDSRLSVCRITRGTRSAVTTADVTTGSVGERTAPRRKASAQVSSGKSAFPQRARKTSVSGMATTSALAGGPQCARRSSPSTKSPSEKSVRMSASSTRRTMSSVPGSASTMPVSASATPATTESTEIESTVPCSQPESAATITSRSPKRSKASTNPMSIAGAYEERAALGRPLLAPSLRSFLVGRRPVVGVVADVRLAAPAADAAPGRPEDDREQGAERADDHQDPADRRDVEAVDLGRHREGEDRSDRYEEDTYAD